MGSPNTNSARVSALVRSTARVTLARTLDSVAAQTYEHVNIHVVGASGHAHPDLPSEWNGRRLTFHPSEQPLSRAAAANRLLEKVNSEYFAFVDDDDEWLPDHLSDLVVRLNASSAVGVAYSQAAIVDEQGKQFGVLGHPFHALELSLQSPMAFHSALFRTEHVTMSRAKFDETLARLEDTDFLLALSTSGVKFTFTSRVSAVWNAAAGTSGHGFAENVDRADAMRSQELIQSKWRKHIDHWMKDPRALLALARTHLRRGSQRQAEMVLYRLAKHQWTNARDYDEFIAVCELAGVVDQSDSSGSKERSDGLAMDLKVITVPAQTATTGQKA